MEALQEGTVVEMEAQTVELALTLGQGILTLMNTTPAISGKLFYALSKNEQKLSAYAKKFRVKQGELLDVYVEKDEKGAVKYKEQDQIVPNGNPFLFKDEESEQKYEAELTEYLTEKVEDFPELHKVERVMFEALTINPQQNRDSAPVVDYLSL
jgi:hypothetical protein